MFRLVILSHIDSYIRQNTFFQRLHIFVEMRTGGEADAPSVRQFRCERKSRTATCLVTDLDDLAIVYAAHQIDEIIGCTVATAVGQYNDFLLPADAVGRFQVDRFRLGKVTMSCSRFMLYESGQDFTIGKSGGNAGRISQITSSVVAYIDNQSVAGCQIDKDFIQIAIADPGTETFVYPILLSNILYFIPADV